MKRTTSKSVCTACLLLSVAYGESVLASNTDASVESANSTTRAPDTEVAPYQLKIIKRGEGRPRASNKNIAGRRDNRRVDIKVLANRAPEASASESQAVPGGGVVWVSTDPVALDKLLKLEVGSTATVADGTLVKPLELNVLTNYASFATRAEIRFFREGQTGNSNPLHVVSAGLDGNQNQLVWDGSTTSGNSSVLADGVNLELVLRVYDARGNFDETGISKLRLVDRDLEEKYGKVGKLAPRRLDSELDRSPEDSPVRFEDPVGGDDAPKGYDPLVRNNIPVSGARVRVHGMDLGLDSGFEEAAYVNNEKVKITNKGEFLVEYLLPPGEHEFSVSAKAEQSGDGSFSQNLSVSVDPDYFFMVGLADLTVGENDVSGSIEPLAVDRDHYGGDIFVDGRLAFYLKGKVKGKYLVTAQLDTGTEDVSELFDDFNRKDPNSVFRRLDPEQYYLVYGDDSNLYDDTDSQGKMYVRVEWDKSTLLWGNFNTAFSGTDLAPFNRSLYGAKLSHSSVSSTSLGDANHDVGAFISEAQTAFRHNEFLGTGGSLYYLKDKDIVLGSEKVSVVVRRSDSEQVVERINLVAGRDYEIDEFQGRLILRRPLLGIAGQSGPSIIRDEPVDGDSVYLLVDYEYLPDNFDTGNLTAGFRGRRWLNDHVALGGTWAYEERNGEDYEIKGVDLTLKKSDNTFIRGEVAQSEASQTSGSFVSTDGGLNFTEFNSNEGVSEGTAYGVEGYVTFADFADSADAAVNPVIAEKNVKAAAWYKQRDAGFSTARHDSGADTTDAGLEISAELNQRTEAILRSTFLNRKGVEEQAKLAAQINYRISNHLEAAAELRHVDEKRYSGQSATQTVTEGNATLAALRLAYDINTHLNVYGSAQSTLQYEGNYERNNRAAIGAEYALDDRLRLNGELSTGDRGDGIVAGVEWTVTDSYSLYSNLSLEDRSASPVSRSITFGQRKQVSRRLKLFSEHQFTHEDQRQGTSHTLGLDHAFTRYFTANLSVQVGQIDDDAGDTTDRDALSVGFDYRRDTVQASSRFEYRRDSSTSATSDQWVVTNRLEYQPGPSLRWQGKLNASQTEERENNSDRTDAKFIEAGIGFAYRPVTHDRLNLLGRLTYVYDLPPQSQSLDADRRSLISSVEGLYELSQHWSIGAKLAHREGAVRLQRNDGDWVGNDASLAGFRLHYRVPFGFELLGGYRWLVSDETASARYGGLIAVGADVQENLRFSVGYNFAEFDDDLGNDDHNVRGWFVNLVGKY